MNLISKIFRFFFLKMQSLFSFCRILKLKILYPDISIDFKSTIQKNCSITCIIGGSLVIRNSIISYGANIVADVNSNLIIEDAFIGRNSIITAKEKVIISKGAMIGEMSVIRDQDHDINIDVRHTFITAPIVIGEYVWIASKATILKGVTIGSYAVIAASAVVNSSVPAFEVWGGVPAKFIKCIKNEAQSKCLQYS